MKQFRIKVAGHIIEIETIHIRPYAICRDYIVTEGNPVFYVKTFQKDIDLSRKRYETRYGICGRWDGLLEVFALHDKISEGLIDYSVLLFHSAVIAVNGEAFLFTAPSRTGKTTHILKWLEHLPDAYVVNGDKPFIKFSDDGTPPLACGSPWAGKENLYTNTMVPLKSIILMERAEENHIEQISFAQAFPALLQQIYHPDDEGKMRKTLRLMQRLNPAVSFWRFQCNNFKDDCFDVAYNALVKGQP